MKISVTQSDNRSQKPHFASPERWLLGLLLVIMIAGWEMGVTYHRINTLFWPAPSTIVSTIVEGLLNGSLLAHLGATLFRLLAGLIMGGGAGLCIGLLMGWSPRLDNFLDPLVVLLHPMPKIALLPLVMLLLGIGERSKIVTIALSCFFPMLLNTVAGVQQISPIYWEVARNYGAKPLQILTRVLLPSSLPLLITGLRLALNTGLIVTLSLELLTTQTGLGAQIWLAWQTMRLRYLYATLVMIGLLGYGFHLLLIRLAAYLMPWQSRRIR